MSLFPVLKYIEYLFFSRHLYGHGIHSPFVFNLVSGVMRNKIDPDIVCSIETLREKMISNREIIKVNDLGSGSRKMIGSLRKVSELAINSAVSKKYGIFLSRMSESFSGRLVIEFGTSLGISTMYIAASCPDATVCTMEGCPEISGIAARNFREAGFSNIRLFTGAFEEVFPEVISMNITPGLVYIDGNHRKEPLTRYFSQVADISDDRTVVIIDDIYSSREMAEAWGEIKNDARVTFTVDIYRMGIVFFREGISPFHYVVRY
jgi:predicted O-methyltransferase YrrM